MTVLEAGTVQESWQRELAACRQNLCESPDGSNASFPEILQTGKCKSGVLNGRPFVLDDRLIQRQRSNDCGPGSIGYDFKFPAEVTHTFRHTANPYS